MAFKKGNSQLLSMLATSDQHGEKSSYFDGLNAYYNDPFHPIQNPNGVIQMGLAENKLSSDLIEGWIRKHPTASICTEEGVNMFGDIANFQDYHGLPEFRNGVARFMGKVRGGRVTFDPDRIVMAGGATGASEAVMFCLADPGDAFLVPTPYYPAFDRDLRWRTRVELVPVNCKSSNNFKITREALEESYRNAIESNIKIKGVIVTNPSNPLGTTIDRETQKILLNFINKKGIHLVCDEIYSATVFSSTSTPPEFLSISEIIDSEGCNRDLVHIIYSLSKDMGMPGFRVGILYSYNDAVVDCGRKMSSFGLVSTQTQYLLASMLSDDEFVDEFLEKNSIRLARRHEFFTKGLEEVGIRCLKSNAGLFCWMDLRPLLSEDTFEAEELTWRVIINDVKLNVSPGHSFHCTEPGWFRVCFANVDDETLHVALTRIRKFVAQVTTNNSNHNNDPDHDDNDDDDPTVKHRNDQTKKKKKEWKKNLRLSFSSSVRGMCDDGLKSPSLMSPRTPISQSQLLKART